MKIGIDLGGSHIGIGVVDENGKIIKKKETDLNAKVATNMSKFIEEYLLKTVEQMLQSYKIEAIGVASPGTPKDGKVTHLVNLGILELDITDILQRVYEGPICVRNDAKCAGLAEKHYGSLKEYDDAVFLCLGTGIGGCAFFEGKEIIPKRNPGFEIGHMIINKNGKQCKCGKRGCFETYCSMKRLKDKLIKMLELDKQTSAQELLKIVKKKKEEEKIQSVLKEYIENLLVGLSNITDILEPEAICLGGSLVYFEDVLYKPLIKEYENKKYVFNKSALPELKLAKLGNDAGIIGATLAKQGYL